MINKKEKFLIIFSLFFYCFKVETKLISFELDLREKIFVNNNIYQHESLNKRSPYYSLTRIKSAKTEKEFLSCFNILNKQKKKYPVLLPWIINQQAICANKLNEINNKYGYLLERIIKIIKKDNFYLLTEPYASELSNNLLSAQLKLLQIYIKKNRKRAWQIFEDLSLKVDSLSKEQKSKYWKSLSELSFIDQKWSAAGYFILKSLAIHPDKNLQNKLKIINDNLYDNKSTKVTNKKIRSKHDVNLLLNQEELKIVERINASLRSKNILIAVENSVKLIKNFPGSKNANWASTIVFDTFRKIISQNDSKYQLIQKRLINYMLKVDSHYQWKWAKKLFWLRYYEESLLFSQNALKDLYDTPVSTKILFVAARSAHFLGKYSHALEFYQKLINYHSNQDESIDAIFLASLIEIRQGNYSTAISYLEKLLLVDLDLSKQINLRFWLWQALKKINKQRAEEQRDYLIDNFSFTYYGLLALAEKNFGILKLPVNKDLKIKNISWISLHEKEKWDRIKLLLKIGWLDEANKELVILANFLQSPEEKILYARYLAASFDYQRAQMLINDALEEKKEYKVKKIVEISFPFIFSNFISKFAEEFKLNVHLIRGLIRQESAFNPFAVSVSYAKGLMQLIKGTALESAQERKLKFFNFERDIFNPDYNIHIGSYYLKKLLKRFDNNISFALAAYNAGPTRIKDWLKKRNLHQQKFVFNYQDFSDFIWIDELPWNETNIYVKSVLRNFLIYSLLEKSPVKIQEVSWSSFL